MCAAVGCGCIVKVLPARAASGVCVGIEAPVAPPGPVVAATGAFGVCGAGGGVIARRFAASAAAAAFAAAMTEFTGTRALAPPAAPPPAAVAGAGESTSSSCPCRSCLRVGAGAAVGAAAAATLGVLCAAAALRERLLMVDRPRLGPKGAPAHMQFAIATHEHMHSPCRQMQCYH